MTHHTIHSSSAGFVAFLTILLVSAVVLSASVSVALLGVGEMSSSLSTRKSLEALKIAEACGEEALLRIRRSQSYTGGTLTFDRGSCTISATSSNSLYTATVSATLTGAPNFTRKLELSIQRAGNLVNLRNWREIE
jgi:hypothetical protein